MTVESTIERAQLEIAEVARGARKRFWHPVFHSMVISLKSIGLMQMYCSKPVRMFRPEPTTCFPLMIPMKCRLARWNSSWPGITRAIGGNCYRNSQSLRDEPTATTIPSHCVTGWCACKLLRYFPSRQRAPRKAQTCSLVSGLLRAD